MTGIRTDPSKKNVFKTLATMVFPVVYGRAKWEKLVDENVISKFFHISTEALVILTIENNFNYWTKWVKERYVTKEWDDCNKKPRKNY